MMPRELFVIERNGVAVDISKRGVTVFRRRAEAEDEAEYESTDASPCRVVRFVREEAN